MFERELAYFVEHQDELVKEFDGRVLVIRGEKVEGDYRTPLAAFLDAKKRFEPGTFMIQQCRPGEDAYTVTITSSALV